MQEKLEQLKAILAEVEDLQHAAAALEWDQQCYMPEGSSEPRSQQLSTLQSLAHEKFTSTQVGELLEALQPEAADLDPDSTEARLIQVTRRQYDKLTKVPSPWVARFYETIGRAYKVWEQARAEDDFSKFEPSLEKIVEMRRQYASFFQPYEHVYDPLLDDFEPGMKTHEVQAVFDALRPLQVELVKAISERPQVDDSFLHQPFDGQRQWDFGVKVISDFGYDWEHGRLDKAPHPFTITLGREDVRITTRVDPQFFNPAFFAALHECGHALYEMGSGAELERTPLAGGASMAIHESQSRMWENLVGRSLPFWTHYYPQLQQIFPQLSGVDLQTFYRGVNRVEPSLVRVEADEATYNLHIMLRLEIEIGLMEGSVEVKDLPEIWNSRMLEYLGLTPDNNTNGVLQDVHWSNGYFGYFPTYALGNVVSAQFWQQINQDIPDLQSQIESGQFDALLGWVRNNIHQYGKKFEPQELMQRITGSKIDPQPYIDYLQQKYSQVYEL